MLDSRREAVERRNTEQARRLQEMNDQTVTQEELDEMADEFMHHWLHRFFIESVSPTTGETVTYTGVDGTTATMKRTDTFDAAYDRVANWSRALATEAKRERSSFAAFESAALGEW